MYKYVLFFSLTFLFGQYDYSLEDLNPSSDYFQESIGTSFFPNQITLHYFGSYNWGTCTARFGQLYDLYQDLINDGYYDDAVEKLGDHTPSGGLRGGKYSLFEAGAKVPFIAYWKGKIKPNVSNEIISQIDLFNSISTIVGTNYKSKDGIDFSNLIYRSNEETNGWETTGWWFSRTFWWNSYLPTKHRR